MNRVKHKVHGRPLIHAHVKKIQPALASLVGSQSRQLSYIVRFWITKMTRESSNWFSANPRVQSCFQRNSCLLAWGPVECSKARPAPMSGAAGNLLHPQPRIRQPPQVPWTAAVPKSRVENQQSQFVTQAQVKVIHFPSARHPIHSTAHHRPSSYILTP